MPGGADGILRRKSLPVCMKGKKLMPGILLLLASLIVAGCATEGSAVDTLVPPATSAAATSPGLTKEAVVPAEDSVNPAPVAQAGQPGVSPAGKAEVFSPADVVVTAHDALFTDVTAGAGVGFVHHARDEELLPMGAGVVVFDFNNNSFQDIYVSNSVGPNSLYRNQGDGTFTDVAAAAGVDDPGGRGNGGCAADYNNDGHRDLFVTNYGPSRLFRNNGDGAFVDMTAAAGMKEPGDFFRSAGCAWADYDQDGFLDLIVVRHLHEWDPRLMYDKTFEWAVGGLVLYHGNGDGTFTNVTELLGDTSPPQVSEEVEHLGSIWGAGYQPGWVDYDNDGDLDLYVVNDMGQDVQPNVLWRNDGPSPDGAWSFYDVSFESRADVAMWGMALAVGDYNLDGFFDLYMTNIGNSMLLKNNGDGTGFTDTTIEADVGIGLIGNLLRITWGAVFFDYDNDGDEDLYVVSGNLKVPEGERPANPLDQPNVLLRNNRDGTFADVSLVSGADDDLIGRGGAYLDFDNDGCLDLYVANYGGRASLLRNACDSVGNWLIVKTVGTTSNYDGIGARVTVAANGTVQIREVASGGSHMGQNMLPVHFGLGAATSADWLIVKWPSGNVQTLAQVPVNQQLVITEPR